MRQIFCKIQMALPEFLCKIDYTAIPAVGYSTSPIAWHRTLKVV